MKTQAGRRARDRFFTDKTVLVTGGTRGLGIVLARELLARGARVAACARDEGEIAAAQSELGPERFFAAECDVSDRAAVGAFVEAATQRFGPVDVAINDAGTIVVGPYQDMTLDDIRRVVEVNFFGAVNVMDAVVPEMRRRKRGAIVNVASVGGLIGVPHLSAYCAAKFALDGFSQTVAAELRRDGIFVSVVNPGLMRTGSPMNATFKGKNRAEYGWFSISDSLPFVTVSAESAARAILRACERRRPFSVLTAPAKLGALLHALAPNLVVRGMTLVNALLPAPAGATQRSARGHESESPATSSPLTESTRRAARANNEWSARRPASDLSG